jgi:hypothetical protein
MADGIEADKIQLATHTLTAHSLCYFGPKFRRESLGHAARTPAPRSNPRTRFLRTFWSMECRSRVEAILTKLESDDLGWPAFFLVLPGIGHPRPPAREARACVRLSVPESVRRERAWLRARELGGGVGFFPN